MFCYILTWVHDDDDDDDAGVNGCDVFHLLSYNRIIMIITLDYMIFYIYNHIIEYYMSITYLILLYWVSDTPKVNIYRLLTTFIYYLPTRVANHRRTQRQIYTIYLSISNLLIFILLLQAWGLRLLCLISRQYCSKLCLMLSDKFRLTLSDSAAEIWGDAETPTDGRS